MQSDSLRALIRDYNWDDGFFLPQAILNDPACDLALALEIFYLADGYALLNGNAEDCTLGPRLSVHFLRILQREGTLKPGRLLLFP